MRAIFVSLISLLLQECLDRNSLQLIKHFRKSTLDLQSLLDLIGADEGILAIFQEARALMFADKSDEALRIGLPIHREALKVFKNGPHASGAEKRHGILRVLVEVCIEDALIHEVGLAVNRKQYPPQIMQFQRRENIWLVLYGILNIPGVFVKESVRVRE